MNHNLYLFTILYVLITAFSSYSMETNKEIQKITVFKKTRLVQYLTQDRIIIAGDFEFSIANTITNEKIAILKHPFINCSHLAIHPNRTKIALSCNDTIVIYDAQTYKEIWSKTKELYTIESSIFDRHDENIFIFSKQFFGNRIVQIVQKYNYLTNKEIDVYEDPTDPLYKYATLHPTEKIICFPKWDGTLRLHKSDDLKVELKKTLPFNLCTFCKYNPDGSHLIIGNHTKVIIIDPKITHENLNMYPFLSTTSNKGLFEEVVFYNRDAILATMLQDHKSSWIKYWNIKTQTSIYQQAFPSKIKHYIAFCPGKTKVMVISQSDECSVWPVPKEVIQEHNNLIKEKMIFPWLILMNYQLKDQEIPNDVTIYILSKLHQAHFVA